MANKIQRGNEPDWLHLSSTEEVLWSGRQTAYSLIGGSIFGVVLLVAGIAGTALLVPLDLGETLGESVPSIIMFAPLILSLFGLLYLTVHYLRWRLTYYVVTTEELYHRHGILSQNVQQMRIARIQNTTCNQSLIERLLSFGDITIYTAGSDDYDFILRNVPSPQEVNRKVTRQLGEIKEGTAETDYEGSTEQSI